MTDTIFYARSMRILEFCRAGGATEKLQKKKFLGDINWLLLGRFSRDLEQFW